MEERNRLRAWGVEMEIYSSWMVIGTSNCWFSQEKQNPHKPTFLASSSCPNLNAWMSSHLTQSTYQNQESGGFGSRRTLLRIWKLGWDVVLMKVQDVIIYLFIFILKRLGKRRAYKSNLGCLWQKYHCWELLKEQRTLLKIINLSF